MIRCQLCDLSSGTIFEVSGIVYKIGSRTWTAAPAFAAEPSRCEFPDPKELLTAVWQCEPLLGGRFQPKLYKWFRIDTNVTVKPTKKEDF